MKMGLDLPSGKCELGLDPGNTLLKELCCCFLYNLKILFLNLKFGKYGYTSAS